MNSREELIKRLREAVSSDHARGCEGRQYACDCGHDLMIEGLLEMAADEIERNAVAQRPLPAAVTEGLAELREIADNTKHQHYKVLSQKIHNAVHKISAALTSTERCPSTTSELLDRLLSRINFDGMDPNTFTIAELRRAI